MAVLSVLRTDVGVRDLAGRTRLLGVNGAGTGTDEVLSAFLPKTFWVMF